ncbi:MAG: MotA/TolQ/ExbB proton channel family protein [Veillonellales bacterium]
MDFMIQSFHVFQKGGPVMYLLLLGSLFVVAIAVERFFYYKKANTDMQQLLPELTPLLERGSWDNAMEVCRRTGGVVSMVAGKGIQCYQQGNDDCVETVLEGEASLTASRLRENLNYLDTIVTMAPLVGLLGTVIGMINSFSVMNVKSGQPMAITGGVGEALVATASGLVVAILAMAAYSYFTHRLDQIITDIEQICTMLVVPVKRGKKYETA